MGGQMNDALQSVTVFLPYGGERLGDAFVFGHIAFDEVRPFTQISSAFGMIILFSLCASSGRWHTDPPEHLERVINFKRVLPQRSLTSV